jgi:hypothetical protein
MYKEDGLAPSDMGALLDAFPNQTLDFFGALRSAQYDSQIRDWIRDDVLHGEISGERGCPALLLLGPCCWGTRGASLRCTVQP